MMRKIENENYRFVSFLPDAQQKIPKKIKKLKKTITDSFQAKIGRRRMRKRENKNYSSVSYKTRNRKFQKKQQKNQKIKKYRYCLISSQNRLEEAEKERK